MSHDIISQLISENWDFYNYIQSNVDIFFRGNPDALLQDI